MIADKLERFVESDLVLNLNAPCALADTSWIRPGKTTFPWWNDFFHEDKVPFEMGLNTETAKYYIDFCAEAGIPYHSLDGKDNIAWYGGTIIPHGGGDITRVFLASTSARCFVTPRRKASRSASGCTGKRLKPTWTGLSRSTMNGVSRE